MQQWYEKLFENFANNYDKEPFVTGTTGEVDFIEKEINYDKTKIILDIACGTGRHSIELAKRGYSVSGFDLSEAQLSLANNKARQAGVSVEFFKQDARNFNFANQYNLAIMICEGAFPLMETDEMNFAILRNAFNSISGNVCFTLQSSIGPTNIRNNI